MQHPRYWELVYALAIMADTFLIDDDGKIDDLCISAGEETIGSLTALGLIKDGKLVCSGQTLGWFQNNFGDGHNDPNSGAARGPIAGGPLE